MPDDNHFALPRKATQSSLPRPYSYASPRCASCSHVALLATTLLVCITSLCLLQPRSVTGHDTARMHHFAVPPAATQPSNTCFAKPFSNKTPLTAATNHK